MWYSVGFRLETRLIELNQGKVLWHEAKASGIAWTGPSGKKDVVRKVLRSYPSKSMGGSSNS